MGAIKKAVVKPAPEPKRYWAFSEEDVEGEEPGYFSPEEAANVLAVSDGEVVIIYEMVRIGEFRVSNSVALTPIK